MSASGEPGTGAPRPAAGGEPRDGVRAEARGRATGDGGFANLRLVAAREFVERVRSRLYVVSTVLLATLAVVVALIPLGIRLVDRATVTRVLVAAPEQALTTRALTVMDGVLNGGFAGPGDARRAYVFAPASDGEAAIAGVAVGDAAGAVVITRRPDGGLAFALHAGEALGADRTQLLGVGAFAVAILDWTSSQPAGGAAFAVPSLEVVAPGGGGGENLAGADYASRRIVGIVFVVLAFLTLVFYGMWVAAGVVAEKTSRVMELLISAATAPQLVGGKILGIGLAGLLQVGLVLAPALLALVGSGAIGDALLGPGANPGPSLAGLSPGLLAAFVVYFGLGFALYAALYAAAGSLVSRAEDLQVVALPLSLPALAGYLPAVLALTGGSGAFIRFASYVPFWSPFVMLSRLSVGRVQPWEVALSLGLLAATVPPAIWLAIRVYRAGVLQYGQPPTVRAFLAAIRHG